jgi:hypothetical protein
VAGDAGGDRLPPPARGGERLEREPAPVADLDRVATLPRGEQVQNPALEEGGVHAELQGHARAGSSAGGCGRSGHMGDQRIVARVLPVMRVEARNAQPTVAPVRITEPSTSIVRRGRSNRASASVTRSRLSATSGASVSWVNWRNQSATVRRVGTRARPQKRVTRGSPLRWRRCSRRRAPT